MAQLVLLGFDFNVVRTIIIVLALFGEAIIIVHALFGEAKRQLRCKIQSLQAL